MEIFNKEQELSEENELMTFEKKILYTRLHMFFCVSALVKHILPLCVGIVFVNFSCDPHPPHAPALLNCHPLLKESREDLTRKESHKNTKPLPSTACDRNKHKA